MVAFNFSPQFAPLVEARTKLQTIRRGNRVKVGDRLQLYTGQRTKNCRKLVTPDPICIVNTYVGLRERDVTIGDVRNAPRDFDDFARADGFPDYAAMWKWFSERYETLSFTGRLIRWRFDDGV